MSTPVRRLLVPLIPLYRAALAIRELRLERGWEPIHRLRFPVISVGNLSTGGAGKTPFTIALAQALSARGFAVDVLSRGYGRQSGVAARVHTDGSAEQFGDEPLLIARNAGVPVYVARERYEAGLLAEANASDRPLPFHSSPSAMTPAIPNEGRAAPQADGSAPKERHPQVHILDDAFQHRQLHRDIDILLLNRDDWHDRLLPAGNLRESRRSFRRATVICIPECESDLQSEIRALGWQGPVWRLRRRMEPPLVEGPVVAFCGIARAEQFFTGLESSGLRLAARITFRDHHRYVARDLERLQKAARERGSRALVTTEKDRVRLDGLAISVPGALPLLTVGLRIEILDESAVLNWLTSRLQNTELRPTL